MLVWIGLGIVLLAVLLVILCIYYNNALKCQYYYIEDNKIPNEFVGKKIVMLSDLHEHSFGKNNARLLELVMAEEPDYIMIPGDLLVKGKIMCKGQSLHLLSELRKKYPVYVSPGNHEDYMEQNFSETGEFQVFLRQLQEIGVTYLDNETVLLGEREHIQITGLHLPKKYFGKFYESQPLTEDALETFIGSAEEGYRILLAHNPNYFPVYEKWGADLILSGHVHGGVVILPFIGGVISTTFALFPKYDFGLFQEGKAKMVLSRGLGVHTIKLRVFNVPEISVIYLGEEKTCEKARL